MSSISAAHPMRVPGLRNLAETSARACGVALRERLARGGDVIANAAGTHFGVPGSVNPLNILRV